MVNIKNSANCLSLDVLNSRLPVWQALSDFWLDTELQDFELEYIARVLADSPYSLEEIKDIHQFEVAPAVSANFLCVAGVWVGFDKDWLMTLCQGNALNRKKIWHRVRFGLQGAYYTSCTSRYWQQVIPRFWLFRRSSSQ